MVGMPLSGIENATTALALSFCSQVENDSLCLSKKPIHLFNERDLSSKEMNLFLTKCRPYMLALLRSDF